MPGIGAVWGLLPGRFDVNVGPRRQPVCLAQSSNGGWQQLAVERGVEEQDIKGLGEVIAATIAGRRPVLCAVGALRTSVCRCCCSALQATGDCSTSSAEAAPRLTASRPSAPLPAKRSRQCASAITGANQLKSVSRRRSPVGLRPGVSGNLSFATPPLAPDDAQACRFARGVCGLFF